MEEEIGAQERLVALFEKETCIPAVRKVRSRQKPQSMTSNREDFVISERSRRPVGKIVDGDHRPDKAANCLRIRRDIQQFIQGAALVGLEMAKPIPAQLGGFDQGSYRLACDGKHLLHARMHDEWLVVFDQELIKLNTEVWMKRRNPINVRRNFRYVTFHNASR